MHALVLSTKRMHMHAQVGSLQEVQQGPSRYTSSESEIGVHTGRLV